MLRKFVGCINKIFNAFAHMMLTPVLVLR